MYSLPMNRGKEFNGKKPSKSKQASKQMNNNKNTRAGSALVIPAFERQSQEDLELKASLCYMVRSGLKNNKPDIFKRG
jgi:hypothetical protein